MAFRHQRRAVKVWFADAGSGSRSQCGRVFGMGRRWMRPAARSSDGRSCRTRSGRPRGLSESIGAGGVPICNQVSGDSLRSHRRILSNLMRNTSFYRHQYFETKILQVRPDPRSEILLRMFGKPLIRDIYGGSLSESRQ